MPLYAEEGQHSNGIEAVNVSILKLDAVCPFAMYYKSISVGMNASDRCSYWIGATETEWTFGFEQLFVFDTFKTYQF